jgi:PPP family 3-phenylpropionic acid transporter
VMARGQGYLAACSGMVYTTASILSGMIYARYGQGVYYLMAAMAFLGGAVMWLARERLAVAFSSEVDTGSREENASKQEAKARF